MAHNRVSQYADRPPNGSSIIQPGSPLAPAPEAFAPVPPLLLAACSGSDPFTSPPGANAAVVWPAGLPQAALYDAAYSLARETVNRSWFESDTSSSQ